jgi:formylglycine-generating enzyme required for sulfatase activity
MPKAAHISTFTLGAALTALLLILQGGSPVLAQSGQVLVPGGSYHSVFPEEQGKPVPVDSFLMDRLPVTNAEFLAFVVEYPRWRKSEIPAIFAGSDYLRHWSGDLEPGNHPAAASDRPATRVSWYAASAYCSEQGGRLPTLAEWEYAAMAMDFDTDKGWNDFGQKLVDWYSAVNTENPKAVGSTGIENQYGVQDLHGLVMEWVEDYRPPVADDISIDCGTAGRLQGQGTQYNYARVIRTLTRMSFKPHTATVMIGFRCAYDLPESSMSDSKEPKL